MSSGDAAFHCLDDTDSAATKNTAAAAALMWRGALAELGFQSFRPGQLETLEKFGRGQSVITVLKTGMGKSLIFTLIAKVTGAVLVIAPTQAVIENHRVEAAKHGIHTWTGGSMSLSKASEETRLMLATPEHFFPGGKTNTATPAELQRRQIVAVIIDEAHRMVDDRQWRQANAQLPALVEVCAN